MLRRLLIAALAGMLLVVVPATESEAANVCWCRAADMAERVADADHVFKFRIDELVPKTEHKAVAFGAVCRGIDVRIVHAEIEL